MDCFPDGSVGRAFQPRRCYRSQSGSWAFLSSSSGCSPLAPPSPFADWGRNSALRERPLAGSSKRLLHWTTMGSLAGINRPERSEPPRCIRHIPCPTLSQVMTLSPGSRTGLAAILAGLLYFAGQAGELAFGNALNPLWVALVALGIAAFVVAIWGLGGLV